jgi:hypothetical protein
MTDTLEITTADRLRMMANLVLDGQPVTLTATNLIEAATELESQARRIRLLETLNPTRVIEVAT